MCKDTRLCDGTGVGEGFKGAYPEWLAPTAKDCESVPTTRQLFPPPLGFPCETATPAMYPSPASAGGSGPGFIRGRWGCPSCLRLRRFRTAPLPSPHPRPISPSEEDSSAKGAGRSGCRKTDRPVYPQAFFFDSKALESPEPRRNTGKPRFGGAAKTIPIGNFPASRPSGNAARHRGRHRRAAWPGGIGGSNRTGSGRQAPAAQRVAHRVVDRMADRRRRAGKREGSRLFLRSLLSGASAGRCGRTSGVDGADIGRGNRRVKEIIYRKGNNFWCAAPADPPQGGCGRRLRSFAGGFDRRPFRRGSLRGESRAFAPDETEGRRNRNAAPPGRGGRNHRFPPARQPFRIMPVSNLPYETSMRKPPGSGKPVVAVATRSLRTARPRRRRNSRRRRAPDRRARSPRDRISRRRAGRSIYPGYSY